MYYGLSFKVSMYILRTMQEFNFLFFRFCFPQIFLRPQNLQFKVEIYRISQKCLVPHLNYQNEKTA